MRLIERIKRYIAVWLKSGRTLLVKRPEYIPHFNGKSLKDTTVLNTMGWYCFGLLWLLTAIEMVKTYVCNSIKIKEEIEAYFKIAEDYLTGRLWLNTMITISACLILGFWLVHVWKDRYLSLRRICVSVCLMIILSFASTFTNVHSAIRIDYVALCWYVLFMQLILDAAKLWYKRWGIEPFRKTKLQYITELPQEKLDTKVRLDYAKRVAEWLFNTDISESAFAVGITSEWGSGKTSFLLDLKNVMAGKCYMMDFKPWHCQTPDQIVNEFFELFRKEIKSIYSPLQKPILRYAQLLSDVSLPNYVNPIFRFLPEMGHSIEGYKSKIEEGLKQLDKPVVVAIDDMDRLAADEMFEVLRLIRNTAAFPNLIFVVCYDKEYVVKQIQNMGIDESDLYLEKIFPLELSLPKTEEESLIETFRRALIDMHFMHGRYDALIKRLSLDDEQMMVRLLPTFRKMKRFARLLMTNTMFTIEKLGEKNIDLHDMYLIELVHFCMSDVYMVLRDRPEEMLEVRMDEAKRQARYFLKDSIFSEEESANLFKRQFKKYEVDLLRKCFDERVGERIHYLPYIDSYQNYFCMSTPSAMISKTEFKAVLEDRSNVRKNVHDWFWKILPKKSASLYSRMMNERVREMNLDEWKGHVYLMIAWMCEANDVQIKDVFRYYFLIDNLRMNEEDADIIMGLYSKSKIEKMINGKNVNRMNVATVLTGYYSDIKKKEADYLLGCDDVKELLKMNFMKFMEEKQSRQDAINVIALNGNDINAFVKANSFSTKKTGPMGDDETQYTNLIIDEVIGYFGAYEEKSSHLSEAKNFYEFSKDNRYRTLKTYNNDGLVREKHQLFGSDEKFRKFLMECFVEWKAGEKIVESKKEKK